MFCSPCILLQSLYINNLTHNYFSYIGLFQFSTCFEQPSANHQESQLYQYGFYLNLKPHGHLRRVANARSPIDTIDFPDDEDLVPRNIIIIIYLFTAIGLSPGGSCYFTCKQNIKSVTTKFKSGGLHQKHVVATWNVGNRLSVCL